MKNVFSILAFVLFAGQVQAAPTMYLCHSPMNIDAQWDVRVSYSTQEESFTAQLLNPRIGPVVAKPRGAPIRVTERKVSSPGAILFQGRDFTLAMNSLQKATTIVQGRGKVEGIAGQINGTLPDSGNSKASFNGVNVVCEVIRALHGRGGR